MKNRQVIILTTLVVIAFALAAVSLIAFVYAARSTTVAYPSTNASGTYGYYPNGMMGDWSGMMGGMMGGNWGQYSAQTQAAAQNTVFLMVGFVTLIGAALTGTGGAVYYLTVPRIRMTKPEATSTVCTSPQNVVTPYASVSKTLTSEERKVLDVLVSHDGKYLQKYIRAETGVSRLKTHRIVSRLAERGIVTLEKSGNTNVVHLSNWLQPKPRMNPINQRNDKLEIEVRA
jgi:uncharacterized membrane protein